jgi:Asp-tRNA(Asn)/Glu-tRNA(Gln) amidotransferase A subunit family amidase
VFAAHNDRLLAIIPSRNHYLLEHYALQIVINNSSLVLDNTVAFHPSAGWLTPELLYRNGHCKMSFDVDDDIKGRFSLKVRLTTSEDEALKRLEAQFEATNAQIHAFLPEEGRFERLRQEVAALESRYPEPALRPPLYGVPVGVKDIFHVDGLPTYAGSRMPPRLLAGPEAECVTQLKEAGALVLGKTVTTEFAYFAPGPTRNPHNHEHTPGGSSSGSAAAVAAGLCPLALGTQTIGSVLRPASFCGVLGFKPTSGRISRAGVIPLSPSLDHIGFFAQDVALAAVVAHILCRDWDNQKLQTDPPILGVPLGSYLQRASPEALDHFEVTQAKLKQAGFEIRPVETMPNFEQIVEQHVGLVAGEAAMIHQEWFILHTNLYHPKTAALIRRGQEISTEQLTRYRAGREEFRADLETLMTRHNISAWISPSALGTAPPSLDSTGDPIMNLPWTYAGLPAINLPAGFLKNRLPLGLQLVAGWGQDEKLLAWAHQIAPAIL